FYPQASAGLFAVAGSALLLAAATVAALTQARTRPWIPVGWLWFLGTLVPVIGIVQVGQQAMADRYAYVPMIGLSIAIGFSARGLARPPVCAVLFAGAVACWAGATWK